MYQNPLRALVSVAAAALLAACGGGDGDVISTATPAAPPAAAANLADVLGRLATPEGMTSSAVAVAFDDAYMDSGMSKPQVLDALKQEAGALQASADHSLFPQMTLENVSFANCDGNNVCTLNGTLHNTDADDTAVPFSTKVQRTSDGSFRVLGDQLAS